MGLNEILHKLAAHINPGDPIHQEIDDAVPPEKDGEEEGKEDETDA